ncbi:MAG: DNA replication protein [Alphaproteobacteria bacterium CG11_big_fil_rev_8_21_14_0_20_39_49]|nr:MAG: DNA replication protein [Alphaproteobacteria bacterium CG11_big_fil_rev_8_21_14_0_20_39_49]
MSQKSFDLSVKIPVREDDYIISNSNVNAFSLIGKWPQWDSKILLLYGSESSGKTHLAKIWCKNANAISLSAEDIYTNNFDLSKNHLLDDLEKVCDEPALLHFYNMVKEADSGYLLMTAGNSPSNMKIRLADLRSRLGAVASIGINDPDDEILRQILVKRFASRQLKVDMDVIKYIVSRMERSFLAAEKLVDILDKEALKQKKNITIPFVKTLLEN